MNFIESIELLYKRLKRERLRDNMRRRRKRRRREKK